MSMSCSWKQKGGLSLWGPMHLWTHTLISCQATWFISTRAVGWTHLLSGSSNKTCQHAAFVMVPRFLWPQHSNLIWHKIIANLDHKINLEAITLAWSLSVDRERLPVTNFSFFLGVLKLNLAPFRIILGCGCLSMNLIKLRSYLRSALLDVIFFF